MTPSEHNYDTWKGARYKKGTVETVLLDPTNAEEAVAGWKEGERFLVLHFVWRVWGECGYVHRVMLHVQCIGISISISCASQPRELCHRVFFFCVMLTTYETDVIGGCVLHRTQPVDVLSINNLSFRQLECSVVFLHECAWSIQQDALRLGDPEIGETPVGANRFADHRPPTIHVLLEVRFKPRFMTLRPTTNS